MDITMTAGTVRLRVKEILDEKGITIVEAAKITGLNYHTIAGFYKGHTVRVDYNTLAALCDGLQVTPADLIEYSPSNQNPLP